MRRALLLLLPVLLLLGLAYWISARPAEVPAWKSAWREAQLIRPNKNGANMEALLRIKTRGGTSALARGFARGAALRIRGDVAPSGGELLFEARAGSGTSRWRELRRGRQSALLLGGLPYRTKNNGFLGVDWFRDLRPEPLLRAWPLLRGSRALGGQEGSWYSYRLQRFPRQQLIRSLQIPLLLQLGFAREGAIAALVQSSSGAPGGFLFQKLIEGRQWDQLLGLGEPSGIRSADISLQYRILRWKVPNPPLLPDRPAPGGGAALDVALLPFFVGLQGGQLDSQGP